MLVVNTL